MVKVALSDYLNEVFFITPGVRGGAGIKYPRECT